MSDKSKKATNKCNCRNKQQCLLKNNCQIQSVVYICEVESETPAKKKYIGLTGGPWKERYYTHKHSFNNEIRKNDTAIARHVWKLKYQDEMPKLKWEVMNKVPSYLNRSKKCNLCLREKLAIITYENRKDLLNKNNELISKCLHEDKFLLTSYKNK